MSREMSSVPTERSTIGRLASFRFALRGIGILIRTQINARIHAIATVIVIVMGLAFHLTIMEWIVVVLAIGGVWTAEAINTAVELVVDLVSPDYHDLAAKAKDVAAGAVLIAAIGAAIVGVLVFGPFVLGLLGV